MPNRFDLTPKTADSRTLSAISPACNKAFVGIQPLCKQVPPRTSRSIRATFKPSWEPRNAAA